MAKQGIYSTLKSMTPSANNCNSFSSQAHIITLQYKFRIEK